MDKLSLFFALLGIALTIIFSDVFISLTKRIVTEIAKRIWSAREYRRGSIYAVRHFGFEDWSVKVVVNDAGDTDHHFSGTIVNLGRELLRTLYIPFFSDSSSTLAAQLRPWARSGDAALPIEIETLEQQNSQGRIAIFHTPPLAPGERRALSWGFTLPGVFAAGDDYFNWDVEVPYYEMSGELLFSEAWIVLYARWKIEADYHVEEPMIEGRRVSWTATLPPLGTRLHIRLGLAKIP